MSNEASPVGLSARFAQIIDGLCAALGEHAARERRAGPFVFMIQQLLERRLGRFVALVARFYAGKLAARPPEPDRAPSAGAARERYWDPMPRDRAWLWRLLPSVADYLGLFEELLADPEMARFLKAAPHGGRLLRPLWWIVSPKPFPGVLRTPIRQPSPPESPAPRRKERRPLSPGAESPGMDRRRTRVVRLPFGTPIPE